MDSYIEKFAEYLEIQKGASPRTITAYRFDLNKFKNYLVSNKFTTDINKIDRVIVRSYLSYLSNPKLVQRPNTIITRTRKLSSIKSFFNFLYREELIKKNLIEFIEAPKLPKKEIDYLTIKEYKRLLRAIRRTATKYFVARDIAIISLFISTGIRVSELISLRKSDVDLTNKIIKVHRKGNKDQTIPLNFEMAKLLFKLLNKSTPSGEDKVFLSKNKQGIKANTVYELVKKYLERAEIHKSKHGPHLLRHTCFTTLLSKNVNPVIIQTLAGHSSFDTTRRYLHLTDHQIKDAVSKISI
jgi:site-specific recombinase XerD